jgi:hypothetical protein
MMMDRYPRTRDLCASEALHAWRLVGVRYIYLLLMEHLYEHEHQHCDMAWLLPEQ